MGPLMSLLSAFCPKGATSTLTSYLSIDFQGSRPFLSFRLYCNRRRQPLADGEFPYPFSLLMLAAHLRALTPSVGFVSLQKGPKNSLKSYQVNQGRVQEHPRSKALHCPSSAVTGSADPYLIPAMIHNCAQ